MVLATQILFKISPKTHLRFWMIWGALRWAFKSRFLNALFFLKIAWNFLRGRLILVDTHESWANGGYKYYSLVISKKPVSANHEYDEFS
jgi:hypothetical protein